MHRQNIYPKSQYKGPVCGLIATFINVGPGGEIVLEQGDWKSPRLLPGEYVADLRYRESVHIDYDPYDGYRKDSVNVFSATKEGHIQNIKFFEGETISGGEDLGITDNDPAGNGGTGCAMTPELINGLTKLCSAYGFMD